MVSSRDVDEAVNEVNFISELDFIRKSKFAIVRCILGYEVI